MFQVFEPGYGGGLRVLFNKATRTNLALDYAYGKFGNKGFFLNLNEAFNGALVQFFCKEINGPFPGQLCCGFIITGGCIVMEPVVYIGIDISCILFPVLL